MSSEVLADVRMSMLIFWVVTPSDLHVDTNVSEEHTASIFKAKNVGNILLQNVGMCI
jgi:hypothetical protein